MTEYLLLQQKKLLFYDVFKCALEDALEFADVENNASLTIQRVFRGTRSREKLSKKNYAAAEIQRVFRGIFGRNKAEMQLRNKLDGRQLSLYFYLCIQIQKSFRGYYSRKYKHDQNRRRRNVLALEEKNAMLRQEAELYAVNQANREAVEANNQKETKFRSLAQNLHHLMSTKQIRGVFNPSTEFINVPLMNEVPVEEHVRGVVKDLLRTRGISKTRTGGLVPDINGTLKIPLKGLKNRLSLQASAPYDALEREKRREKTLHNILIAGKGNFLSGGTTNLINRNAVPLSVGDPFMDSWANPMLVKGVPKDQSQLLASSWNHKALFAAPPEKPFTSRVGGNKSTTLHNDLFDVIAEAEETGGAIQRQLGTTTSRFGLPASVDNRYDPNSTIPMPPIRASATVKSTRPKIKTFNISVKAQTLGAGGDYYNGYNSKLQNKSVDDMSITEEDISVGDTKKNGRIRPTPLYSADSSDDEDQ